MRRDPQYHRHGIDVRTGEHLSIIMESQLRPILAR
jgi:hypothetical protein